MNSIINKKILVWSIIISVIFIIISVCIEHKDYLTQSNADKANYEKTQQLSTIELPQNTITLDSYNNGDLIIGANNNPLTGTHQLIVFCKDDNTNYALMWLHGPDKLAVKVSHPNYTYRKFINTREYNPYMPPITDDDYYNN